MFSLQAYILSYRIEIESSQIIEKGQFRGFSVKNILGTLTVAKVLEETLIVTQPLREVLPQGENNLLLRS